MNDILELVDENANAFYYKWDGIPLDNERKFLTLISEIGELADSIKGKHEHPKEVELVQIAGICINWLTQIQIQEGLDLKKTMRIANHTEPK